MTFGEGRHHLDGKKFNYLKEIEENRKISILYHIFTYFRNNCFIIYINKNSTYSLVGT